MLLPASYANGFAPRDGRPLYPELWRGCVGAWNPGLGVSGSTLRDWSGFQNNGTLTNGPTWAASQGRYAMSFDGINDHVVLPSRVSFIGNRTLAAWIKMTATNVRGGIFGTRTGDNGWVLRTSTNSTLLAYHTVVGGNVEGSINSIVSGKWHLAAYTYSPGKSQMDLYLDGIRIGGSTGYSEAILGTAAWIADEDGTSPFPAGQIDDIRIYDRVLSTNEIRLLATRRGIAYEMAPRRRSSVQVTTNRRRRIIIGGNR